jgi:hypothetical protein
VCGAHAGIELAEFEAEWAQKARKVVEAAQATPEFRDREIALVPTFVKSGTTYVVFREVGDAIKPERFYKHHAVQVILAFTQACVWLAPCVTVEPESLRRAWLSPGAEPAASAPQR